MRAAIVLLLVLSLALGGSGCASLTMGARDFNDWSGDTLGGNYVSFVPFTLGWVALGLASLPLLVLSVPLTDIFYSDHPLDPSLARVDGYMVPFNVMSGVGGSLVALPFYPLGVAFPLVPEDEAEGGAERE